MVAKPVFHDLAVDYALYGLSESQAAYLLTKKIPWRNGKKPLKVFLHIQDGKTRGSLTHWLGVSASSTYMANRDGTILRVIPEVHGPWTNGDVCQPLTAEVGAVPADFWNDPNPYSITIEAEGTPWEPLTQPQLDAIEWLVRDIMSRYPDIDITDVERHRTVNTCTRWNCPGASDNNDYYLAIQKRIGAGLPTNPYADPILFDFLEKSELDKGIDREVNGTKLFALRREWVVIAQTHRYRRAITSGKMSNRVGPDLYPGEKFRAEFIFSSGGRLWVLTEYGTRVLVERLDAQEFAALFADFDT
jgi:hypothetical protein